MILDTINRSLQIVLGEAKITLDCDIVACWAATSPTNFVPTTNQLASNGVTPVTVVAPPPYAWQCQVSEVRLFNNDSVVHQVILRLLDGATVRVIQSLSIQPGGHFVYTPGGGAGYLQKFWRSS